MNTYLSLVFLLVVVVLCSAYPGNVHYEKVRIHVPTKIKTIYKTQIIKVPEHHHHHHETVKEVPKYIAVKEEKHEPHLEHYEHSDISESFIK